MSNLESESGQKVLLPTESHDFDNNAESKTSIDNRIRQFDIRNQNRFNIQQIIIRMLNIFKEISLMILVAFTYAALTNDPPKVSKSPSAYPFFSQNSLIKDWYKGEISTAIEVARQSDIAFVMFYAPWNAESQEVRWQFELTAKYMDKVVTFAAVNCWHPESECRNQYSKVYNWPVLIAYPAHGRGVQYNGPKTAIHMIRFLNSVIRPLKRVNEIDVHYLLQSHDAVILANVNFLPGSLDYATIYSTSLRFLENDPFHEIAFAVNTYHTSLTQRELIIYTWNDTLFYFGKVWKTDILLNWIYKHINQITKWISPTGSKSRQLSNYIQPGPALILFTPKNPLFYSHDYYDLLHEVGLEYYNCKNNTKNFGSFLLSLCMHNRRIGNYKKITQTCTVPKKKLKVQPHILTYSKSKLWANNSFCSTDKQDVCESFDTLHETERKVANEDVTETTEKLCEMYHGIIENRNQIKNVCKSSDVLERYKNIYKTSMLTGIYDPRSPQNLMKAHIENECKLQSLARKYAPPVFSESIINTQYDYKIDIKGLACESNRSLTLVAMDSLKYHHFAESLGIDILNYTDKTAAVILNEKMETYYVLNGSVNDRSLREFIYKFTENNLSRAFYSGSRKFKYTHSYPYNKLGNQSKVFSVIELSAETFLPTVMQTDKAVIVLYHSKQCSFCSGISYTFLTIAKALSVIANVKFARIDGDLNTLPWEYTMEVYPTILFFPAKRKSESRVFPRDIPMTVGNLASFILTNMNPNLKLYAMWALCNQTKFDDQKPTCISSVRAENLSLINKTLKEWRKANVHMKAKILDKLQLLRNLHLLLAHSPGNVYSIQKDLKRLQLKHYAEQYRKTYMERKIHTKEEL